MKLAQAGSEHAKSIFGVIVTFFIMLSFVFMGFLMIISFISDSAYKKVTRGHKDVL